MVWLGDIFDHPRPTYRSFRVAQRALARIRDHGVRAVVISGNHDTPRLPGTGSPYSALADSFPEMHFAHRLAYERFELPGLVVHAVPQMLTVEAALDALDEAARQRSGDRHQPAAHPPPPDPAAAPHADINEIEVDAGRLQSDLVLLGHYHTHARVSEGMWYAGSTDTFSFADDPDQAKGIVVLDTDTGDCRHVPLAGRRPLVTLEPVFAPGPVARGAAGAGHGAGRGRARGRGRPAVPRERRPRRVPACSTCTPSGTRPGPALLLKLEPQFVRDHPARRAADRSTSLGGQWDGYLDGQDLTGLDRERVRRARPRLHRLGASRRASGVGRGRARGCC